MKSQIPARDSHMQWQVSKAYKPTANFHFHISQSSAKNPKLQATQQASENKRPISKGSELQLDRYSEMVLLVLKPLVL